MPEVTPLNLGSVGINLNGVPFKMLSTNTFGVESDSWRENPVYTLSGVVDGSNGIIDSSTGEYYYISDPVLSYDKNPTKHSPIIGYAFDGYPIYGPYGYLTNDGKDGNIIKMTSSYKLKEGLRDPQQDDSAIPAGNFDGKYIQDYEYLQGHGTLDENNGRFSSTPEYPDGIYHYHVSIDENNNPVYPYIIGGYKGSPNLVRGLIKNNSINNLSSEVITYEIPTGGDYLCEVGEPVKQFDILMSGIAMHDYITSPETLSGIISREGTQQQYEVSVIKDFDNNKGFNMGPLNEAVIYTGSVLVPQETVADTSPPAGNESSVTPGANEPGGRLSPPSGGGGGGSY